MFQPPESQGTQPPSRSRNYSTDEDWAENRNAARHPERRLWAHVLRRQVWDFVLYRDAAAGTEEAQLAEDAAGWLWWDGTEEVDEAGRPTFHHVCDILGMEPAIVREATLRLTRNDISRLNNQIKEDA